MAIKSLKVVLPVMLVLLAAFAVSATKNTLWFVPMFITLMYLCVFKAYRVKRNIYSYAATALVLVVLLYGFFIVINKGY